MISFEHKRGISFRCEGGPSGVYRWDVPKPCFHPLVTAKGVVVTGFEPGDHWWHRGLWFAIKYVNGVNFWEEHAGEAFGVQVTQGEPACEVVEGKLRIVHRLVWRSDKTGDVLEEMRVMHVGTDNTGVMTIEWTSELTALQDLLLDRTPYTTWGGYSGFSFRGGADWRELAVRVANEKKTVLVAERADAILLEGMVGDAAVFVQLSSHPENPRSPMPWYGKAVPEYVFLNAAFLFHEPMQVGKGERLVFRHACSVGDGA